MLSRGGDQSWAKELLEGERRSHCSLTTTIQASEGPERHPPPQRSWREQHLNVERGGSPVPAPSAGTYSPLTDHG